MTPRLAAALWGLCVFLLLCAATPRGAGAQFPPLTNNDYNLDLYQGAVLGSTRVIGLGGAYVAVAEGSEGIMFNPAAAVNRTYFSNERFDWTWHVDFLLSGGISDLDFDNNGRASPSESLLVTAGLLFQYGNWGIGLSIGWQVPELGQFSSADVGYNATLLDAHLSSGYGFLGHQLIVAGGLRVGSFGLAAIGSTENLFDTNIAGVEAGVLLRPRAWPLRIGAALSIPFDRSQGAVCDDRCPKGFFLPRQVSLPWEVRVGVSYRFGPGRFNPTPDFVIVDREREQLRAQAKKPRPRAAAAKAARAETSVTDIPHAPAAKSAARPIDISHRQPTSATAHKPTSRPKTRPRTHPKKRMPDLGRDYRGSRYILVSAEVVIIGPSENAIGADGFALQEREPVGKTVNLSAHLGVEAEVWRRRLRLRVGTYWEPSRYENRAGRLHGTASLLFRLFDFSLWGPHALAWAPSVDVSSRYFNFSFLVSFWH